MDFIDKEIVDGLMGWFVQNDPINVNEYFSAFGKVLVISNISIANWYAFW